MDLPILNLKKVRADQQRFFALIGISLVLHTVGLLVMTNVPMFRRHRIDPDKIYHVRLMDLGDLPIAMRQRLGSGGGGIAGMPGGGKPGKPGGAIQKPKKDASKPELQSPKLPKPPEKDAKAQQKTTDSDKKKSKGGKPPAIPEPRELKVPASTKKDKKTTKTKRPANQPPSFESRWGEGEDDSFWESAAEGSSSGSESSTSDKVEYRFDDFGGGDGQGTGDGGGGFGGTAGSMALDNADFVFYYYLTIIKDKIGQNWNPPVRSGPAGETRKVIIFFRIEKTGSLTQISIEDDSGIPLLDQSALRAVQVSAPFPPLPRDFDDASLGVHFGFECTF